MIQSTKSLTFIGALLATGCGAQSDVCQAASEHIAACLGSQATTASPTCDAIRAEEVLDQQCDSLRNTLEQGKADSWFSDWMCEDMGYMSYCDAEGEKANLEGLLGDWEKPGFYFNNEGWQPGNNRGCPRYMRIVKHKHESGLDYQLRVINKDGSTGGPVWDRADFTNINQGRTCTTIESSATQTIRKCTETVVDRFSSLTQTTRVEERLGLLFKPIPGGAAQETQGLTRDLSVNFDQLTYSYDGPSILDEYRCHFEKMK